MLIAASMYSWKLTQAGSSNDFYTSAVISMSKNFKNFWFASFDPSGFITVDKPPVALWLMVISVKIFGFHGWSVVLPSVITGIFSIYLLYKLVTPYFGRIAGNLAALAMTFTPVMVADTRSNNLDTILVFFLLLSLYVLEKSFREHRRWLILVSFALIGIAFNVKMIQAFMILPTMYLFYFLYSKQKWFHKIKWLAASTVVLIVFTLIWPLSVDMTPASQRPYEGGTQHNSVMELAFGYNGVQRLVGQKTGVNGAFKGMTKKKSQLSSKGINFRQIVRNHFYLNPDQKIRRISIFTIGIAGPQRLLQSALGPQISWLLPFAILGLIAAFLYHRDQRQKWYYLSNRQKQIILWAGWLIPVGGFFSIANFFHPYYTIMLAPPIAALFGIGFKVMLNLFNDEKHGSKLRRWWFPVAVGITAVIQFWYISIYYRRGAMILLASELFIILVLFIMKANRKRTYIMLASCLLILAGPIWWSLTPVLSAESAPIPYASPGLFIKRGISGAIKDRTNPTLFKYLKKHDGHAEYLFAASHSNVVSPYIIRTKKSAIALGGYNGTDPAITLKRFKKLVENGQLKYYLDDNKEGGKNNVQIVKWVRKHGRKVKFKRNIISQSQIWNVIMPVQKYKKHPFGRRKVLYDLSGIYKRHRQVNRREQTTD